MILAPRTRSSYPSPVARNGVRPFSRRLGVPSGVYRPSPVAMTATMETRYEIQLAGRVISRHDASTARDAVIDYVRSLGCRDDEMVRVAADAVAWRGAVYSALPAVSGELRDRHAA
jgi:hypothetical protein